MAIGYKIPQMKRFILFSFFLSFIVVNVPAQSLPPRIDLPNGWHLTPAGGRLTLGDLPLNIVVDAKGHYLAVTNNGQSVQSLMLIDTRTGRITDSVVVPELWLGLAFNSSGNKLYASGGNDNRIIIYNADKGKLHFSDTLILGIKGAHNISPAGLSVDDKNHSLYVVTKYDSCLYVFDLNTKKITGHHKLPAEGYTCLLSPDTKLLYISVWGGGQIAIYNIREDKFTGYINTGNHPNDMALTHNGDFLFVANANDNSVSVISTKNNKVIETLDAALYSGSPEGSTTNSVALSSDNKLLYIANADNNMLAVFDVSTPGHSFSKGFIPTGWYPTCVRVFQDTLYVANGKGFASYPDPYGPNPSSKKEQTLYHIGDTNHPRGKQYIGGGLLQGTMSIIPEPTAEQLAVYSQAVYDNTPFRKDKMLVTNSPVNNPIPERVKGPTPIKYVFYILKENRTYDQVLGDMSQGNGDSTLCLFPKKITPNEHAIASEFVLMDNFYVDAEVSADGHNWSMGAYANDYVEKTWPTNYGGRGNIYDYYAGVNKIANPPSGFIWDDCLAHHIRIRNYGEFADNGKVNEKKLAKRTCPDYPGWNLAIQDVFREGIWERDFDSLLHLDSVPQFNSIYLPDDHTSGMAKGAFSPFAAVADNDLALGRVIAHLSLSPIWKKCAVFVIEDDAQNGPDHVDAHRSIAFVAGGMVKKNFIDHTLYSTSSVLRTIELILGLPPMSQYDASATPLWNCFSFSIHPQYAVREAEIDINKRNTAYSELMRKSNLFHLEEADEVPMEAFNEVLWKAIKGDVPMPPARHSAFVKEIEVAENKGRK